jgi:hypothetical protein
MWTHTGGVRPRNDDDVADSTRKHKTQSNTLLLFCSHYNIKCAAILNPDQKYELSPGCESHIQSLPERRTELWRMAGTSLLDLFGMWL